MSCLLGIDSAAFQYFFVVIDSGIYVARFMGKF